MNDLKGTGVGVINADLIRRELMFQKFVDDAFIGERPRGIETECFQVPGQNFHGGDAALLDGADKLRAVGEGEIRAAP